MKHVNIVARTYAPKLVMGNVNIVVVMDVPEVAVECAGMRVPVVKYLVKGGVNRVAKAVVK